MTLFSSLVALGWTWWLLTSNYIGQVVAGPSNLHEQDDPGDLKEISVLGLKTNVSAVIPLSSFSGLLRGSIRSYRVGGGNGKLIRATANIERESTAQVLTSMNVFFRTDEGHDDNLSNNLTFGSWSFAYGWENRAPRIDLGLGYLPFELKEYNMSLPTALGIAAEAHFMVTWTVAEVWKPKNLPIAESYLAGEVCYSLKGLAVARNPSLQKGPLNCLIGTKSKHLTCGYSSR